MVAGLPVLVVEIRATISCPAGQVEETESRHLRQDGSLVISKGQASCVGELVQCVVADRPIVHSPDIDLLQIGPRSWSRRGGAPVDEERR